MRDDQRSDNPSDQRDRCDAFDDALDDLFGPDTDERAPVESTPPAETLPRTPYRSEPYPAHQSSPSAYPTQPEAGTGSGIRGWSWRKTGCVGCLAFIGVVFACLVILFIIGLTAGDPAGPTPVSRQGDDVRVSLVAMNSFGLVTQPDTG